MRVLVLIALFSLAAAYCERNVTFTGPWSGGDAWLVDYTGPFENDRPPHVQVGKTNVSVQKGQFACLSNLRTAGSKALEWDVDGVWNSALGEQAVSRRALRGSHDLRGGDVPLPTPVHHTTLPHPLPCST